MDVVKPSDENKERADDGDFNIYAVVHLKPVSKQEFNQGCIRKICRRGIES